MPHGSEAQATQPEAAPPRQPIDCPCGWRIFDGEVIRARVVRLVGHGVEAKCRCKEWLRVPLWYRPLT